MYADIAEATIESGVVICKPNNAQCNIGNLKTKCYYVKNKNLKLANEKFLIKEKKYNIYCYLKKQKKEIALTKNKNFGFLSNFKIPETKVATLKRKKNNGWVYLCNYKKNISNVKMDINLFYKFTKNKPEKYTWHSIDQPSGEFIPTFTKKIFKKVAKLFYYKTL